MQQPVHHHLLNNDFWLTTERCIYWQQQNAVLVSDLHFGKTGHFRKHGIGVPQDVFKEDLQRLVSIIAHFKPEQIIAVGDLFHSHANKEMDWFSRWRKDFSQLVFHLAKGNHDILGNEWYAANHIHVHEKLVMDGFSFIHDTSSIKHPVSSSQQPASSNYIFSGHMHPSVSLKVGSKQNMNFPCFYFGEKMAVLPAFSRFSGTMTMKPKVKDSVYAIVEQSILKV